MSGNARDLRNAGLYLVALLMLAVGLVYGGTLMAERIDPSSVIQAVTSEINSAIGETAEDDDQDPPTRLSVAVENAREIRAALERPIPPPPALQPITAKLAHGHLIGAGKAVAAKPQPRHTKLPKAALDAMASAGPPPAPALPRVELHRVY